MCSNTVDEVDAGVDKCATAPAMDETNVNEIVSMVSSIKLDQVAPTAPIPDTVPKDVQETSSFTESSEIFVTSATIPEQPTPAISYDESTRNKTEKEKLEKKFMHVLAFTDFQLSGLYSNKELTCIDAFVTDFLETELRNNAARQQHRLHELLMSYLRVRNNLIINAHELESLKKNCKDIQKQLWCLDKAVTSKSGECQDGNPVSASHEYSIAHFNQQALIALTKNLSAIKDLLHNAQALYSYEAELLKLQIDHHIQRLCMSCKEFGSLAQNAPVNLTTVVMPQHTMPQLMELRTCITILFNFQRRVLRDGKFVMDSREWLSKLVAILLRVANWQDHMFILNHILRCPGGVTNWAIAFVQTPAPPRNHQGLSASPLNDPYLDHMIATLAVMLLPIREREKFLEQVQISLQDTADNAGDTVWVMLDEEGEEDEDIANTGANLYESDLIALVHQIPLEKLFEHILSIDRQRDQQKQMRNLAASQHHHVLRLFAFSTVLVRLLKEGLKTYDSPRYRQLAKRLSALIRDIVQYATDEWETFDKTEASLQHTTFSL